MATDSPNAAQRQDSPPRGLLRAFQRLLQKGRRFSPKGKKDAASNSDSSTSNDDPLSKSPSTKSKLKLPPRPSKAKADDEMTPPPPFIRYAEVIDWQSLPNRTVSRCSLNKEKDETPSDFPSKAKDDQALAPPASSPAAKSEYIPSDSPSKVKDDKAPEPSTSVSSPKANTTTKSASTPTPKIGSPFREVTRVKIPLRDPDYQVFVDVVPKNDVLVSHDKVRAWLKSWFDVDELFESDVGVDRFVKAIWMDGNLLYRVSEKGLGEYMSAINVYVCPFPPPPLPYISSLEK
jgi:hypothetical protein